MKVFSVKIKFGDKFADKKYDYLTFASDIIPGDKLIIDMGTRLQMVTAISQSFDEVPDTATAWVVQRVDMDAHLALREHYQEWINKHEERSLDDNHDMDSNATVTT
ncbi:MAG: hypothetical protein KAS32_14510 [Candidatus Peribacteraceae bacterium]|nr:hypothetical protein [Candidatus Peribacteraceae bacterium]